MRASILSTETDGPPNARIAEAFAEWVDGFLRLGNRRFARRYYLDADGGLVAASLTVDGVEWLAPPDPAAVAARRRDAVFRTFHAPLTPAGRPALHAVLSPDDDVGDGWRFAVADGTAAVTVERFRPENGDAGSASAAAAEGGRPTAEPDGIERAPAAADASGGSASASAVTAKGDGAGETLRAAAFHLRLRDYAFADQTDRHDNLLRRTEDRLSPVEPIERRGVLFGVENPLTGDGLLFLKLAPLPERRPVADPVDFAWDGAAIRFVGERYPWAVAGYRGGEAGATAALQAYQRDLRAHLPGRDGLLLSNTWGDRHRDAALNEGFMRREIDVAAALGVDVCQIDDGWQAGVTANSSAAAQAGGGAWEGYHAVRPDFWTVHRTRFPDGLGGLRDAAAARGVRLGLWFSPDSADDFAHWEDDVRAVVGLEREYGASWIKIDGVKTRTRRGEANLLRFFREAARRTAGRLVFDLDVTAEVRPGYFGMPSFGPLFVENRYTDWRRYWPHATLRNLWQLAHAIPPARLRMECPNPARNAELYGDDPLAPRHYGMDWIFASVMVASPLLWCELGSLPTEAREALARIVPAWRRHRDELHAGTVWPVGPCPDGASTSGFLAETPDGAVRHLILLRDLDAAGERELPLPVGLDGWTETRVAGEGRVDGAGADRVKVSMPGPRHYMWSRFTRG